MFTSATKEGTPSIKSSSRTIGEDIHEAADAAEHDLRATANKMGRKVRGFLDESSEGISHAAETVSTRIHEKPVQSSMIALGVGVVLGILLRR